MDMTVVKCPPNPQAITRHILQLSNSRFEIFQMLPFLLAIMLKAVRSRADKYFHSESSALVAASNPPQQQGLCKQNSYQGFRWWKERCVCLPLMCVIWLCTLLLRKLDPLADLWLVLQLCRWLREQHSSFLCWYFKAGFLLLSITGAVCKLRSFQGLILSVRALKEPCFQGGVGVKIKSA